MNQLDLSAVTNVLTPPTIPRVETPLNLPPIEPSDFKIDEHGELLRSFWTYRHYTNGIISAFNHWVQSVLPQQLMTRPIIITRNEVKSIFRITRVVPSPHGILDRYKRWKPFYPKDAIEKQVTYHFKIEVEVTKYNLDRYGNEVPVETSPSLIEIGQIPAMTGSSVCNLYLQDMLTPMNLLRKKECPSNPMGYFIIDGTERALLMQDHLRTNRLLLFVFPKTNLPICRMTCNTPGGTKIVTVYHHNNHLHLTLGFMGQYPRGAKRQSNSISVMAAFALMGYTDSEEILSFILMWTSNERRQAFRNYLQTDRAIHEVTTLQTIVGGLAAHIPRLKGQSFEDQLQYIRSKMEEELFPHIENQAIVSKLQMLGMMSSHLLEFLLGYRGLDDRDSWELKRVESAGKSLEQHFRRAWSSFQREITKSTEKLTNVTIYDIFGSKMQGIITNSFHTAFVKNAWGSPEKKGGANISVTLDRGISPLAAIAELNKITTATSENNKTAGLRMVHPSQYGIVDPAETTEGKKCGLIKYLSVGVMLSEEHDDLDVKRRIPNYENWVKLEAPNPNLQQVQPSRTEPGYVTRFVLNGRFYGWCQGERFRDYLIDLRRHRQFIEDACIVLERPGRDPRSTISDENGGNLFVYTDASRPVRPLLIVNPETQLTYIEEDFFIPGRQLPDFMELLAGWQKTDPEGNEIRGGYIEYLDPYEIGNIYGRTTVLIAQSIWFLEQHRRLMSDLQQAFDRDRQQLLNLDLIEPQGPLRLKEPIENLPEEIRIVYKRLVETRNSLVEESRRTYTHCELDPVSLLGITASLIPLPNHNQGVRNSYQCAMSKQSLGIAHSNYEERTDNLSKVLAYPTRPLFASQTEEIFGQAVTPSGETVMMAIMTWAGANQEDAIIFNKRAIDLGKFRYARYATIRVSLRTEDRTSDYKAMYPPDIAPGGLINLSNIGQDGIIKVGKWVKKGDVLVTRYRIQGGTREEAFQRLELEENEGIVQKVILSPNAMNPETIIIRIRSVRTPVIGDKTACFDDQTQILTLEEGWIPFPRLTKDHHVACLVGRKLEYHQPEEVQVYDYEGDLISLPGPLRGEEWRLTPNHRVLIKQAGRRRIVEAGQMAGESDYEFLRQAEWTGQRSLPAAILILLAAAYTLGVPGVQGVLTESSSDLDETPILRDDTSLGTTSPQEVIRLEKLTPQLAEELRQIFQTYQPVDHCEIQILEDSEEDVPEEWSSLSSSLTGLWGSLFGTKHQSEVKMVILSDLTWQLLGGEVKQFSLSRILLGLPRPQVALFLSWVSRLQGKKNEDFPPLQPFEELDGTVLHVPNNQDRQLFEQLILHAGGYAIGLNSRSLILKTRELSQRMDFQPRKVRYQGKVYCCTVPSGIIYVKRRGVPVWSGNSRSAQKQSISRIVPPEEMPWVARDGTIPDVIINPQCILSRMTISMLIEIVVSKVAALRFERVNATGFRPFNLDVFLRTLKEYGFNPSGNEILYSPETGQAIGSAFIGPCHYQLLKHQIADKIHGRSIGGVNPLTRQPRGGRSIGGGLRFGRMELQVLRGFGASHFSQELLCKSSDEVSIVLCSCGYVPTAYGADFRHVRCPRCQNRGRYGIVRVPYSFLLIKETIAGANVRITLELKEKEGQN